MNLSIEKSTFELDINKIMEFDLVNFQYPWKKKDAYFKANLNLIMKNNEEILGLAICDDYDTHCHVNKIVIRKNERNKGLGKLLLLRVINESKNKIFSLNVRKSNKKAIEFYKKIGFVVTEVNEGYYKKTGVTKEDKTAIKMILNLKNYSLKV